MWQVLTLNINKDCSEYFFCWSLDGSNALCLGYAEIDLSQWLAILDVFFVNSRWRERAHFASTQVVEPSDFSVLMFLIGHTDESLRAYGIFGI